MEILKKRSKEYKIDSKFIVFDSISEGYKITDIVLLPSSSESFGYSAIEGLSLGIKTLLTDIPTYREFSKNSNCAYIFGTNADDLKDVLLSLLNENIGRRRISKGWYSDYDLDRFGVRYLELK
jgi:glycosyltransferase involved in cell wall biosynthesis